MSPPHAALTSRKAGSVPNVKITHAFRLKGKTPLGARAGVIGFPNVFSMGRCATVFFSVSSKAVTLARLLGSSGHRPEYPRLQCAGGLA